jgi:hypothetical protein
MELNLGELALRPQQMMQQMAAQEQQMKMGQLQLQQAQQQQAEQAQMKQMVADFAHAPGSSSEKLTRAGDAALRAGLIEQAEKAYGTAGLIDQRAARAEEYKAQTQERQLKADVAKIDTFASLAEMYPDSPAGWNALKTSYLASNPNPSQMEVQLLQAPWRPGMAAQLKNSLLSAKDRALAEWRQQTLQMRQQETVNRERHAELRDDLAIRREERLERQAAQKKKSGSINIPTNAQQAQAEDYISQRLEAEGVPQLQGKGMTSFGMEVASRARMLNKDGLEWDDALAQAYEENKDRITAEGGYEIPVIGTVGRKTVVRPKARASTAAPAARGPRDVTQAEYAKLRPGDTFWYAGKQYTKGAK